MISRLYTAHVMHTRFAPAPHRFRYPVFTFAFDLDELPALDRGVRGFGYNRRALVSLHDRDYLRGEGDIRARLMRFLREDGCEDGVARVELLTMPRMFGHVFNPVSFYYCYRADGSVRCVVAEVNNGGEMVKHTLRTVDPGVPVKMVHASRGKATRAEPVVALDEQARVHHVGSFPELELQMTTWSPTDDRTSPDRVDARVWALTELMVGRPARRRIRTA